MTPTLILQVDAGEALGNAWANVLEITPKIVLFLVILIVGWIIARAVAALLDRILEKVGFDRWVSRGDATRSFTESTNYDASDLLSKVVYYALVLITLQFAFGVFGPNPISDLLDGIIAYLPNIFVAILIIVIAAFLASAARDVVRGAIGRSTYGPALATGAYVAILVIGAFAALDQLEIAPSIVNGLFFALLAVVAGSAIVAIGGGGILPMRRKWDQFLSRAEEETSRMEFTPPSERSDGSARSEQPEERSDVETEMGADLTSDPGQESSGRRFPGGGAR